MRVAVVADIHANLAAFETVVASWGAVDEVWCLGDLVGYGPDPDACVARLRAFPHVCLRGNHDLAALGQLDPEELNPAARSAAEWTSRAISAETRAYLSRLPDRLEREGFTLVHGSPRSPVWEYLVDTITARENFPLFNTAYCLVGHSHVPLTFMSNEDGVRGGLLAPVGPLPLTGARRFLNPGSVGQPRDGDSRASYAILVLGGLEGPTIEIRRVPYAIAETQARMRRAGLPGSLIDRLADGR